MGYFPASDRGGRQVPFGRVGQLVGRQTVRTRRGGRGQTPGRGLLTGRGARTPSPAAAALARSLPHRKGPQQRGHGAGRCRWSVPVVGAAGRCCWSVPVISLGKPGSVLTDDLPQPQQQCDGWGSIRARAAVT